MSGASFTVTGTLPPPTRPTLALTSVMAAMSEAMLTQSSGQWRESDFKMQSKGSARSPEPISLDELREHVMTDLVSRCGPGSVLLPVGGLGGGFSVLVDEADARVVRRYNWTARRFKETVYASRSPRKEDGRRTTLLLHTFITEYAMTDHENGNGLDNRRQNLRDCTRSQNNANRRSTGRSAYLGVSPCERSGKWRAVINKEGTYKSLGYFDSEIDAALAYDRAAMKLHGEFARLNFTITVELLEAA